MPAMMFKIKCITNMHVGSGDINYNLIDNEIERDPITNYPVIHASGVKGALREYYSMNAELSDYMNEIFGCEKENQTMPGKLKFMEAAMLAVPARASDGEHAYYLVSTQEALNHYAECATLFLKNSQKQYNMPKPQQVQGRSVEGIMLKNRVNLLDEKIHILDEADFKKISLPVIARNKLENGISKNLWYEEIVPHKSVFYFYVISNDTEKDILLLDKFKSVVDNQVIQFGANASIGYGLCKITAVEE